MQANTEYLLKSEAPAALSLSPRENLSSTYSFISTREVVDALETDNWAVVEARQNRSRRSDLAPYRKHEIILCDRDLLKGAYNIFSEVPRLILSNSHDGGAQFRLEAGLWRCVCSNGMKISDGVIQSVAVRHSRRTIEEVVTTAQAFRLNADLIGEHVAAFKNVHLSDATSYEFAREAIALRFGDNPGVFIDRRDVLVAQRDEDAGDDLWRTFNRVQEHLLKGGFPVFRRHNETNDWSERKARAIKAIDESGKLNAGLWALAEQFSLN